MTKPIQGRSKLQAELEDKAGDSSYDEPTIVTSTRVFANSIPQSQ
jgi:hypothetical protein